MPTVGEPGTYEWCEEVVECMVAAWRTRETADRGFLAAVKAALEYRIWETLSPPPPEEPYGSLDGLIRRTADQGQAENMQIAIRFSGILEEPTAQAATDVPWAVAGASVAASAPSSAQVRAPAPGLETAAQSGRPLTEEDEIALGNALLDQFGAQVAASGDGEAAASGFAMPVPTAADAPAAAPPRRSAAQRKRDRLEHTHPELAEAVDAGEMTLKQAYIQAGIEKEVRMLDKLQRLWRSASEEERDHFLSWVEQAEQAEHLRQFEQEVYGDKNA